MSSDRHLPTVIVRHRKENVKKCSLEPIKHRQDLRFFTYPLDVLPRLNSYILLSLNAPFLQKEDAHFGLVLIDATWRYAEKIDKIVSAKQQWVRRSLPSLITSYPRKQEDCADPERGLASIEALYAAYTILGRNTEGLLDHYYWRDAFLRQNAAQLQ